MNPLVAIIFETIALRCDERLMVLRSCPNVLYQQVRVSQVRNKMHVRDESESWEALKPTLRAVAASCVDDPNTSIPPSVGVVSAAHLEWALL